MTRSTKALVLIPLTAAAVLAGCGGNDSAGDAATAAKPGAAGVTDNGGGGSARLGEATSTSRDGVKTEDSDGAPAAQDSTSARVLPADRDIVYRGSVTVRVADVARALARAEALTQDADGIVFDEQTSTEPGRRGFSQATLTLRVPPSQFASTLDALGRFGRQLSRTKSAQDVTTEVTDTTSRVRSQERSVARIRSLLAEATTIGEVVQIEAELARREADLESLQAQLARLKDVTDMASIEATFLSRTAPTPVVEEEDELGFVSGFRGGWEALVGIVLVALTVLGALSPFAVLVAVLGLPAYALLRRRLRHPVPTPSADASA